jgi:glutamyl-tRNA reductase
MATGHNKIRSTNFRCRGKAAPVLGKAKDWTDGRQNMAIMTCNRTERNLRKIPFVKHKNIKFKMDTKRSNCGALDAKCVIKQGGKYFNK